MADITRTYSPEFYTTTAVNHLAKIGTNQFRPNRFARDLLQNAEGVDGGISWEIPFDVDEHSVTTQVITGYEAADTNVKAIFTPGHDTPAFGMRPVIVSWVDDAKNSGSAARIKLTKSRVENTERSLMQQLERRVLRFAAGAPVTDANRYNGDAEAWGVLETVAGGDRHNTHARGVHAP